MQGESETNVRGHLDDLPVPQETTKKGEAHHGSQGRRQTTRASARSGHALRDCCGRF